MSPEPIVKECGTCEHFGGCIGDSDIGMCTLCDKGVACFQKMDEEDTCWEGPENES